MEEIIPGDIKQFILQHIDSIAQWEALLLLRSHPQKWDAKVIAAQLFISETEAEKILQQLFSSGFLRTSGKNNIFYQYRPHPKWEPLIEQSAELYKKCLIPMTNLIHSKSKSRIQQFADAFKLRKD